MGFLDRALSMLSGDGGDSSGPRCPQCRGPLRLEDPSDGMHVCDACTGAVYFDEGDGKIIDAMTHRSRVYERHKAAGAFDGPVIYRVTWMLTDGSRERRTQDFTNIDHGYDFYEDRQKDPYCADVTGSHPRLTARGRDSGRLLFAQDRSPTIRRLPAEHRAVAKTESALDATKSRSVARLTHR